MDWRAEAEAHGRDVRGGVAELRLDEAATTQDGATLVITMREGSTRTIRVSMDGCQEQHFNDSLRASLQALVDAQEAEM
ncbi:hypothetical protein T492DRAFT_886359 [Pavlovales sp. CCMP2436]|nr:hypothetical protein T492DRAFT_886359 [Pavlovales sp. CCMP2436]